MLDILNEKLIHQGEEPVAFDHDCREGICGACSLVIDGVPHGPERGTTVCQLHMRSFKEGAEVWIEPWRAKAFPVQKDLIVDQEEFFTRYRAVKPFLINDEPVEKGERIQSPEQRKAFDDPTNCILCAACFSACPIPEEDPAFLGPAAIVNAYRFLADSRDRGFEERLPVLDVPDGVWPCQNHFKCTEACPRSIKITKRINETKRMITTYRKKRGESVKDGKL